MTHWTPKPTNHSPRSEKKRRPYERAREKRTTTREHLDVHAVDVHHVGVRSDHQVKRVRE